MQSVALVGPGGLSSESRMYEIRIKRKRESIFLKHNSRVYSGAIESCTPGFTEAGLARVISHEGTFVAYGWYDEASWTTLHLLSWDEETVPDDSWLRLAVLSSVARRASVSNTQAMRLVHGEADFIPGLAADIYLDTLRIIISARYANDKLDVLLPALFEATGARRASVSVDAAYARLEHLGQRRRFFTPGGECSPFDDESVRFSESGIWYEIGGGISQKSGFYCDQRDNRNIVESYAAGRRVLDACSFTGAFSLHCLRGGAASVLAADSSESVLRHLLFQVNLNEDLGVLAQGSRGRITTRRDDVFSLLRSIDEDSFDLIILDPPKLAPKKSVQENALTGYKDLNLLAMRKIAPGGILATFSCSGALTMADFRMAVAYAAADAGVDVQILHQLGAGEDHPVRLSLPETEYLKGLVLRIVK